MTAGIAELVEAARGQHVLHGIGLTDPVSMRDIIFRRFVAEVAPDVELEYRQEVNPRQLMAALARGERADFLIVTNPARLDAAGHITPFPQVEPEAYPKDWVDRESRWIPLYVQPTVVVYNRYHAPTPPSSWAGLADGRWRDRLVLDAPWGMLVAGTALAEVASTMTDDEWKTWLDRLGALRPLIVGDNERSVLEVATGAKHVGLAPWNVARRVRPTSPVSHVFLDPTPCVPAFATHPAEAVNPDLGRLFLAWLGSSAGQEAYAATGRIPAIPDLDVPTALGRIMPSHARPIFGSVDWLTNPEPYAERYREVFPSEGPLLEGKLR